MGRGLPPTNRTQPWDSISLLLSPYWRYLRFFFSRIYCLNLHPVPCTERPVLHSLLCSPALENDSVYLGSPSYKMGRVISSFPMALRSPLTSGKGPERAGCRKLQSGLARCPSFLLPDAQETMLVISQGDLAADPSDTVY